jgi:hypothetical protein
MCVVSSLLKFLLDIHRNVTYIYYIILYYIISILFLKLGVSKWADLDRLSSGFHFLENPASKALKGFP